MSGEYDASDAPRHMCSPARKVPNKTAGEVFIHFSGAGEAGEAGEVFRLGMYRIGFLPDTGFRILTG